MAAPKKIKVRTAPLIKPKKPIAIPKKTKKRG